MRYKTLIRPERVQMTNSQNVIRKASGHWNYLVVVVSFVTFTPSGPASVPTLEVTVLVFVSPFSSVTLVETLKEEELEKLQAESVKSIRTASARRISFFALFFMVVCSPLIYSSTKKQLIGRVPKDCPAASETFMRFISKCQNQTIRTFQAGMTGLKSAAVRDHRCKQDCLMGRLCLQQFRFSISQNLCQYSTFAQKTGEKEKWKL